MVVATVARFSRLNDVYHLFHMGGVSGEGLFFWQLHLAVLFAGDLRRFTTQLVRSQARVVAGLAHFLARAISSLGSWGISPDLLLLSWRVLQSVLGRPAGLHRGRAAQDLLGRTILPAHHAECA